MDIYTCVHLRTCIQVYVTTVQHVYCVRFIMCTTVQSFNMLTPTNLYVTTLRHVYSVQFIMRITVQLYNMCTIACVQTYICTTSLHVVCELCTIDSNILANSWYTHSIHVCMYVNMYIHTNSIRIYSGPLFIQTSLIRRLGISGHQIFQG